MPVLKTAPIVCKQCGKGWRDKLSLRKHMESAHPNSLPVEDVVEIMDDDIDVSGKTFEEELIKSLDGAKRQDQPKITRDGKPDQRNQGKTFVTTRTEQVKRSLPAQNGSSSKSRPYEPEIYVVNATGPKQMRPAQPSSCWTCTQCDARLLTKAGLEQHIKKEHAAVEAPVICSSCNVQFSGHTDFLSHLPRCRKPPSSSSSLLMCAFCQKKFTSKADFMKHLTTDHPEVAEIRTPKMPSNMTVQMMCGQCNKKFNTRKDLDKHLDETHARPCAHCDSMFRDPTAYQGHLASTHMCTTCGFYGAGKVLDDHRKEHVFPCIDCDKTFETGPILEKHIAETHPPNCAQCQDEFSWPEEGHLCYFTRRKMAPATSRVTKQVLYNGYFHCVDPVLDKFIAALEEKREGEKRINV